MNKKELARFTEGESNPEMTEEEEGEEGEGTIREDIKIMHIESGSPSGMCPQRDLWDPHRGDDGG